MSMTAGCVKNDSPRCLVVSIRSHLVCASFRSASFLSISARSRWMKIWSAERWSVSTQLLAPRGDFGAPVMSTTAMSTDQKSERARAENPRPLQGNPIKRNRFPSCRFCGPLTLTFNQYFSKDMTIFREASE
jgi:hypothetical protein